MELDNSNPAEIAAAMADAEGWNPKDGDEIIGTIVGVKIGESDHKRNAGRDPKYPILFVNLAGSTKLTAVHCFQSILENEVKSARPIAGEEIYIKRIGVTGTAKVKGQNPPIRYAVHVTREAGNESAVWNSM